MKRRCLISFVLILLVPSAVLASGGAGQSDIEKYPKCPLCDMDRKQFAFSRILVTYEDASSSGYCSLHCAAISMAIHLDKTPVKIEAGDYDTRELIDAETAVWVIGGSKTGVMTHRAKWAFKELRNAEAFVSAHGGAISNFDAAMKAAYEDMYADTRMIREKRKKMHAAHADTAEKQPKPSSEEKCPVCGMFVAKYPDWTGVITFAGGDRQYFDGAKDLFKYLFGLEKYAPGKKAGDVRSIHVTDYYDMTFIDARTAFFVIGSDVYGPMGRELIPVVSRPDAETFMKDHQGKKILQFTEITSETLQGLD
ncbi:nitrous oxide reductase accessory protein NosL [Desulfococcus sp.]|uniref:nitrous oxide reductase accessory protein NosL n=1 Tax=Desulfococcus sp. TaxID=2025834 RepID=UPI0035948AEE